MTARDAIPPRLRDLLGGLGTRVGIEDTKATGMLWARWPEIVGETVAANAEPTSLQRGVLRVRATSSTWANELTYLAMEIRRRSNELAGHEIVREVKIWTGPGAVTRATTRPPTPTLYDHSSDASSGRSPRGPEDEPEDLPAAFARAREAWFKRRAKRP
jgi:hypothetical protein